MSWHDMLGLLLQATCLEWLALRLELKAYFQVNYAVNLLLYTILHEIRNVLLHRGNIRLTGRYDADSFLQWLRNRNR